MTSRTLDRELGATVYFKCENLQRDGGRSSFAARITPLSKFTEAQRRAGVVAYSSGNHAQAIALSASLLNIPATIVMPNDAPKAKMEATRGYGGNVVILRPLYRRPASKLAGRWRKRHGLTLIPPYDHPDVIARGRGLQPKSYLKKWGSSTRFSSAWAVAALALRFSVVCAGLVTELRNLRCRARGG